MSNETKEGHAANFDKMAEAVRDVMGTIAEGVVSTLVLEMDSTGIREVYIPLPADPKPDRKVEYHYLWDQQPETD